ncbi:MAG: recombinase family protein [Chitinophagaceae bacterium]|nr:MAG: recombinase family protein [Chitinophagaceae bacterium]
MNIIIYKRVSTDDQADRGFSLQHQEAVMTKYCEMNGHTIIDIYTEDYSAKTFDRPEWKKIIQYLKKNKGKVDGVLCLRWDRFSRNAYEALTVIQQLRKMGVTVMTVEQPLDLDNADSKMLLSIYLTIPEVENDKNSMRTIEGSRRARLEGCWTGTPPRGYNNQRMDKKATLIPNKEAHLITECFERMASGSYSAEEVRRWLGSQGVKVAKQTFLNIIRNPAYTGKIFVKAWKKEPPQIVTGIHKALITEELFVKANDVLAGRKRNMKFHDDKTDLYPLKGYLKCPVHGTSLTAYAARGRSGKLHHYYLCTKCDKHQRHRVSDVHVSVETVLGHVSVTARVVESYKKVLEKVFSKEDVVRRAELDKLEKDIEKYEARKSNIRLKFMDGDLDGRDFFEMKSMVETELIRLRSKKELLVAQGSTFKTYISKTVPLLGDIVGFYRKSDGKTKKKILGCIFSEKLVLEKGKVATTPFSTPVQVLLNTSKGLERSKKKQEVENDLLSIMAPPSGLEPETL